MGVETIRSPPPPPQPFNVLTEYDTGMNLGSLILKLTKRLTHSKMFFEKLQQFRVNKEMWKINTTYPQVYNRAD